MPTGKAIVHWIGCINAIKKYYISLESCSYSASAHVNYIKIYSEIMEILQVKDWSFYIHCCLCFLIAFVKYFY